MGDYKASCRRVLACYRGETADRIPIVSPISWGPTQNIDAEKPGGWRRDEGFIRLARLVQEHCDIRPPRNGAAMPQVFSDNVSYQRFLEAGSEHIEALPPERVGPARTRRTTVLHTPKGDLFYAYDADDGVETEWDIRKPIQCPADVERMLSVPYHFVPPAPAGFDVFRAHRREMGRDAITGGRLVSMVAMLCGMMSFELLLEWVLTEPGLIKLLADEWLRRNTEKVAFLQSQGVGPFWHINGVERASPPMMGPRQWEQLMVPYDGEIIRRIKAGDPGALVHVHCHGRVGTLLDSFLAMGVDSIDPVEPPPQGDIEFAAAKRRAAGRMTLWGNIEFLDMETGAPDQIEEKVRRAIEDGGKAHMGLFPSSVPHERHSEKFLANAQRYLEAGLKYGAF